MNSTKKYEKGFNDLVVLGRSAPEEMSDGRVSNCLAGWSLGERRFVRIYPISRKVNISRWDIISVLAKHDEAHDTRVESYKIKGSKSNWDSLQDEIEKVGRLDRDSRKKMLSRIPQKGSRVLNWEQRSLGLVKPTEARPYIKESETENDRVSTHNYPFQLRVEYKHDNCKLKGESHDQKCINWGVYRYWDKNHNNPEGIIDALHLLDDNWDYYFLIGNLFRFQTAFVIIAVLNFKQKEGILNSFFNNKKATTINSF